MVKAALELNVRGKGVSASLRNLFIPVFGLLMALVIAAGVQSALNFWDSSSSLLKGALHSGVWFADGIC